MVICLEIRDIAHLIIIYLTELSNLDCIKLKENKLMKY